MLSWCFIIDGPMPTGSIAREQGVLKLVHPGGFVEIHHQPVLASVVMARNPRHFVTRPDVFRFPWIVVRPESVLHPGNIFFVVPWRTLYRLLNSSRRAPPLVSAATRSHAGRIHHHQEMLEQTANIGGMFIGEGNGTGTFYQAAAEARTVMVPKPCLKKDTHGGSSSSGRRRVAFLLPDGCIEAGGCR